MGRFTVIPTDTFDGLQVEAGILLKNFDIEHQTFNDSDIICATTGGIKLNCTPTYEDLGSDVDNCPENMAELKRISGWTAGISTTSLGTSAESIRLALGAADVNAEAGSITPRRDLEAEDFSDIWWVGDRADGGCVAAQLKNALSTSGFQLTTTKKGKGQVAIDLTGHVTLAAQTEMPMVIYSLDAPEEPTSYAVTNNLTNVSNSNAATSVQAEASYSGTLTADDGYTISSVTVKMGGVDISATAYTSDTGAISIASVTGAIVITATATANEPGV